MRHHPRLDSNHRDIVAALRKLGALVQSLAALGGGVPDLLVCFRGKLCLMEVKSPGGKLRADQLTFQDVGWPVFVVNSVGQAVEALGSL